MKQIPKAVDDLIASAIRTVDPKRIILFGSRAIGDAAPRSDYDIAIDAPTLDSATWTRFILDSQETSATLLKIDFVRYDSASAELRDNIDRDGIVLYERPK